MTNKLFFHSKLGNGAFGDVYKATWRSIEESSHRKKRTFLSIFRKNGGQTLRKMTKKVAIKQMGKGLISKKNGVDQVFNERNILAVLDHPFICKMYFTFQDVRSLYIVMDMYPGGDLWSLLHRKKGLTEEECRWYGAQMVLGLEHMHHHRTIHRDIKPANILLDEEGFCYLSDFGISRFLEDDNLIFGKEGTRGYTSPEVLVRQRHGCGSDWFALGVTLYYMFYREKPFGKNSDNSFDVAYRACKRILNFPNPSRRMPMSQSFKDLILALLVPDVNGRLGGNHLDGATDVKNHHFFAGVQWDSLMRKEWKLTLDDESSTMSDLGSNASNGTSVASRTTNTYSATKVSTSPLMDYQPSGQSSTAYGENDESEIFEVEADGDVMPSSFKVVTISACSAGSNRLSNRFSPWSKKTHWRSGSLSVVVSGEDSPDAKPEDQAQPLDFNDSIFSNFECAHPRQSPKSTTPKGFQKAITPPQKLYAQKPTLSAINSHHSSRAGTSSSRTNSSRSIGGESLSSRKRAVSKVQVQQQQQPEKLFRKKTMSSASSASSSVHSSNGNGITSARSSLSRQSNAAPNQRMVRSSMPARPSTAVPASNGAINSPLKARKSNRHLHLNVNQCDSGVVPMRTPEQKRISPSSRKLLQKHQQTENTKPRSSLARTSRFQHPPSPPPTSNNSHNHGSYHRQRAFVMQQQQRDSSHFFPENSSTTTTTQKSNLRNSTSLRPVMGVTSIPKRR
eukprot:TRINITY_DN1793_c1_g1_i1.p1 TRINITY_DN1793_c1_g1~~TRINITY_DN1793_c1_g1_i1.p1  ORF type:complete len:733 (-),score=228.07 TRINITY_DN1793_c1_g1_i1:817-3015(-)